MSPAGLFLRPFRGVLGSRQHGRGWRHACAHGDALRRLRRKKKRRKRTLALTPGLTSLPAATINAGSLTIR